MSVQSKGDSLQTVPVTIGNEKKNLTGSQVDELVGALKKNINDLKGPAAKLTQTNNENTALKGQLENANNENTALKGQLATANDKLKIVNDKLFSLNQELTKIKGENQKLQALSRGADSKNTEVTALSKDATTQNTNLQTQLKAVTNENKDLKADLAKAQNDLKSANKTSQGAILPTGLAALTLGTAVPTVLSSGAAKTAGTFLADSTNSLLNMGSYIYAQTTKGLSEIKFQDPGIQSGMQVVTKSLPSFENVAKNLGNIFTTQNMNSLAKNPAIVSMTFFAMSIALARTLSAKPEAAKPEAAKSEDKEIKRAENRINSPHG